MLFQPIWTLLYTLFPFFLGRSHPSLPPAVSLVSAIFPAPPTPSYTPWVPAFYDITEGYFQQLEEFKEERKYKENNKRVCMFSCWWFEEPNLPHLDPPPPLLTGSPSRFSSYSHYLLAGMRHVAPLIPGPMLPLALPSLGLFCLEHFLLSLPSPSCAPGTAVAGLLKVPRFPVSAPRG